jgi:hypothetical protein
MLKGDQKTEDTEAKRRLRNDQDREEIMTDETKTYKRETKTEKRLRGD